MSNEHKPMTDEELAAIQGRLTKATPGPWVHSQHGCYVILGYKPEKKRIDGYGADDHVCVLDDGDHHQYRSEDEQLANAALIAYAPDDISRLLAEVERLRGEVARLDKEADWLAESLDIITRFCAPEVINDLKYKSWREAARNAVEEKERHG